MRPLGSRIPEAPPFLMCSHYPGHGKWPPFMNDCPEKSQNRKSAATGHSGGHSQTGRARVVPGSLGGVGAHTPAAEKPAQGIGGAACYSHWVSQISEIPWSCCSGF